MRMTSKLRKRGLALFMALVLCLSLVQVTAFAEGEPISTDVITGEGGIQTEDDIQAGNNNQLEDDSHEHVWDDGEVTTPATCTAEGVKTFTCTVEGCGETRTEAISVIDHTPVTDARVEPTETETGLTEGAHCSVCNAVLTAQEVIPATGVVIPAEVQAFLNAVYALYDVPEELMLQAVANAETLYNALTGEQKALPEVAQCNAALVAFREPMTLEEDETGDGVVVISENDLRTAISVGGVVVLNEDIVLKSTLTINGTTVSLDLNGHVLSLSATSGSVIRVIGKGSLTVNDSSGNDSGMITGGKGTRVPWYGISGGGICVTEGDLTINGGTISGNNAPNSGGGVFFSTSGNFTMNGGVISHNTAGSTDAIQGGGGVFVQFGTFTMNGGTISDNTAAGANGGGVCVYRSTFLAKPLSGNEISIANNIAKMSGGGVYGTIEGWAGDAYAVILEDVDIEGNQAQTGSGGGIYSRNEDGEFKLTNCRIKGNCASGFGGGVLNNSDLQMTGCVFSGNTSSSSGGGLASTHLFTMDDCDFSGNGLQNGTFGPAKQGGGLWVAYGPYKTNLITNLTITGNYAENGGGIYLGNNILISLVDSRIEGNEAQNGGGVYVLGNDGWGKLPHSVEAGSICNNKAQNGGGVYINGGMFEIDSASAVNSNTASENGGGIYIAASGADDDGNLMNSAFTLSAGTISSNSAKNGGGVYVGDRATFNLSDGTISVNTAWMGGGVYVNKDAVFTMSSGEIFKNTATTGTGIDVDCNGGGVYICEGSTFTMSGDAAISENTAVMRGGGVCNKGTFTMTGGTIQKNQSTNTGDDGSADGAGVYTTGIFEMSGNSLIDDNQSAKGWGGGIRVDAGTCTITAGTISNNSALRGGGVGVIGATICIENAQIMGNTAMEWGGGLLIDGGAVRIENTQIMDNAAVDWGGGITIIGNEKMTAEIEDSTISGNVVGLEENTDNGGDTKKGGGIMVCQGPHVKIKDTTLSGNGVAKLVNGKQYSVAVYGGAIAMMDSCNVTIENVNITDNEALRGGGVSIGDCSIKRPNAGKITNADHMVLTMIGGKISGNKAQHGGGVNVDHCDYAGTFIMKDGAVVSGNTATESGGGVYVDRSSLFKMSDSSSIQNNTAGQNGGGVYVDQNARFEMTEITGGELDNNRAGEQGDDIYSVATGTIHIMDISKLNWKLDGKDDRCTHDITGWFVDSSTRRWNSDDQLETPFTVYTEVTGEQALKAAHNFVKVNVTANYTYILDGMPQYGSTVLSSVKKAYVLPGGTTAGLDTGDFRTFTLGGAQRTYDFTSATVNGNAGSVNNGTLVWGIAEGDTPNVVLNYLLEETTPVVLPDFPFTPTPTPTPGGTTITDEETPLAGSVGLNDTDHFAYVIGYDDDTVRPLNNITRAEAATIFFRLMTDEYRQANWSTTNSFTDVNVGDWYNNAISTCANAGVLKGYNDGTFRPNAPITRAEFASMAAGFMDESITDDGTGDFSDTVNHWAAVAIRRAAKAGWVTGTGNKFNPDEKITRAEVMTIVNRMLDRTPDKDHMLPTMKTWIDNPESEWYYEAVQEATNEHDYERDDLNVETWIELLTVRDWKALETEWANNGGASAPKADPEPVEADGEIE